MNRKITQIALLGSTGSIGRNVINAVRQNPERFKLSVLTAHQNVVELCKQIVEFNPDKVVVTDYKSYQQLKKEGVIQDKNLLFGQDALLEVVGLAYVDKVVNALVGFVGFKPSLESIRQKKQLDLANKESLVVGGELLIEEAKKNSVRLCPIDSEHYALMCLLNNCPRSLVKRLILTASGGPFLNYSLDLLCDVSPSQALNHPNWKMGSKISVDSATLMNKGFEMIEAHYLFGFPIDKIDVMIHPQSVVHSLIETIDGHYYCQMGPVDMRLCIQNALSYPNVLMNDYPKLDLTLVGNLNFCQVDEQRFPLLGIAYDVGRKQGTLNTVLNASNEKAVEAFLLKKIRFTQIKDVIEQCINAHHVEPVCDENNIIVADTWARQCCHELIRSLKR